MGLIYSPHKLACVCSTSPSVPESGRYCKKQRINFLLCTLPDIQVVGCGEFLSRLIFRDRRIMNLQWAREFQRDRIRGHAMKVWKHFIKQVLHRIVPSWCAISTLAFFARLLYWSFRFIAKTRQRKGGEKMSDLRRFVVFIQAFSSTWCDTPYIRLIVISLWQISLKEAVIAAFVAITKSLCLFYWLWNSELKSYKYSKIAFMLKD